MPANDHMNSKRQDLSVKCKTIFKDTSSSVDTRVRLYMRMSALVLLMVPHYTRAVATGGVMSQVSCFFVRCALKLC